MEILLRIVFLYITIMAGSIFFASKFNKKIEECIGLNLLLIIFVLYIAGIFNLLLPAVYVVIVLELLLGVITIGKHIKEKKTTIIKEKLTSWGTLVFTIAFFWLAIISIQKVLTNWDQFSYWSYATKNMYTTNELIINPAIGMQYPPAPTILQYFFMKIAGSYLQGLEAFSMQIIGISLLLPWLGNEKRKKWEKIAITIIIFCLPTIFPSMIFYESSYPDVLLGLLIGYICTSFFKEQKDGFSILTIILGLSILTLIKPIGVFIAIIVVVIATIYEILIAKKIKHIQFKNIFTKNRNIKIILISLITIILVFTSWSVYKKINAPEEGSMQTTNAKDNPINVIVNSLLTTVFGTSYETYNEAVSNQTLIQKMYEVNAISSPIKISIAGVIGILLILSIYFINSKLESEKRKKAIIIVICTVIGLILYSGILQIAYITMFNQTEMLAHAGIDRYLPTYLIGAVYIFLNYILDYLDRKQSKTLTYILITAVIISITPLYSIMNVTITAGISNMKENRILYTAKTYSDEIEKLAEKGAKTYIICEDNNRKLYQYIIRYHMYPTIVGLNEYTENMDKFNMSLEEWTNTLKERNFEYVYVLYSNDEFYEYANSIFEDNKIEDKTLYKIEQKDENIILIPVKGEE